MTGNSVYVYVFIYTHSCISVTLQSPSPFCLYNVTVIEFTGFNLLWFLRAVGSSLNSGVQTC